jgi:DNA transformation protein
MSAIPGIGPKSCEMLARAGITSFEQLRALGAVKAYVLTKATGSNVSLNLLWGLEAVLTGQHWQQVAREQRERLLTALELEQQHG